MCRLVAYLGHPVLLEDVLVKPINSIVMQSLHARESSIPTNGDGFGLGWYAPEISKEPALFKSVAPAWNDVNLLHLTAKIKSPCFLAHVRAASAGAVTQTNCHPFLYKNWMMVHNGEICNFSVIKRHIQELLDDDIYNLLEGETDSEHLFALFIQLSKNKDLSQLPVVAEVLEETFQQIQQLLKKYSKLGPSYYNVCLTDGVRIIASRCCTDRRITPETMHYSIGSRYVAEKGRYHMQSKGGKHGSLLIASEKLTNFNVEWHDVPPNYIVMVDKNLKIELMPLKE